MEQSELLNALVYNIHSSPGVFALLLGSGVSKSAGMPTGWDITIDLIKKLGLNNGLNETDDPVKWYEEKFHKEPEYSKLIGSLNYRPREIKALLKGYFEPTDEEREENKKLPTEAHKAVARMVKRGNIKLIITTNFDRLIEQALEQEGIVPDIVSNEDQLKGAELYVHSKCYILKLHGDYKDSRIKNTTEDLAKYSKDMNNLLNDILENFGLIICGWSGEWDTALVNSLISNPSKRYSIYWTYRGSLKEHASDIIHQKKAQKLLIDDADTFFTELDNRLESVDSIYSRHPISIPIAKETVKKYLVNEIYKIKLQDLIGNEVKQLFYDFKKLPVSIEGDENIYVNRLNYYYHSSLKLIEMLNTITLYDSGINFYLVFSAINDLLKFDFEIYPHIWKDQLRLPALLMFYSCGVLSIHQKKLTFLRNLLTSLNVNFQAKKNYNAAYILNPNFTFADILNYFRDWIPIADAKNDKIAGNNYIYSLIKPIIKNYILTEKELDESYDCFEYFLGLIKVDFDIQNKKTRIWAPWGRFRYKPYYRSETNILTEFIDKKTRHNLIADGLFGGNEERFNNVVIKYEEYLADYF